LQEVTLSGLGILIEAPPRHKDSYVTVSTVPKVLHSNGNAPAREVVLEAVHHGHVAAINDNMAEIWLARNIGKAQGERIL
jgi:hypothetical protein